MDTMSSPSWRDSSRQQHWGGPASSAPKKDQSHNNFQNSGFYQNSTFSASSQTTPPFNGGLFRDVDSDEAWRDSDQSPTLNYHIGNNNNNSHFSSSPPNGNTHYQNWSSSQSNVRAQSPPAWNQRQNNFRNNYFRGGFFSRSRRRDASSDANWRRGLQRGRSWRQWDDSWRSGSWDRNSDSWERNSNNLSQNNWSEFNQNYVALSPELSSEALDVALAECAGPAFHDRTLCDDALDPISQCQIWDLVSDEKHGERRVANLSEIRYLFSYTEEPSNSSNKSFIRGFAVESVQQMLWEARKRIHSSELDPDLRLIHPVSQAPIPQRVIAAAERMISLLTAHGLLEGPETDADPSLWTLHQLVRSGDGMRKLAFSILHDLYLKSSLEIPVEAILNLKLDELQCLAKTLREMWAINLTGAQRSQLCGHHIRVLDDPPCGAGVGNSRAAWQRFVLLGIKQMTGEGRGTSGNQADENNSVQWVKKLAIFVVVGALATVCPEVKERYSEGLQVDSGIGGPTGLHRRNNSLRNAATLRRVAEGNSSWDDEEELD